MSVWPRWLTFVVLAVGFLSAAASGAKAEVRSLKFYHLHTQEKAEIVFKRNGRYDPEGLRKINIILRDWRRNEPTKMDPRLMDLVWEAYRESGATDYIQVVCGYRSPSTNAMLRSRSRGVAEKSQHMLGKAMDFYIPGVPLKKLRNIGLKMQGGGVGYYPTSGSPFVHMDVGNVRHWPGISRQELVSVFPNGKTLHVPSDGRPLPGYEQALAAYKARKGAGTPNIELASAGGSTRKSGGLLAAFFGGGDDEADDSAASKAAAPTPKAVKPAAAGDEDNAAESGSRQDAPEIIMTALPARGVPLPDFARRLKDDTGQQAPGNAPFGTDHSQTVADTGTADPPQVAVNNIPLPTWRPDPSLPARVAPGDNNVLLALADTAAHQTATDAFPMLPSAHPDEARTALELANPTGKASATGGDYQVASPEPRSTFNDLAGFDAASPRVAVAARPAGSDPAQAIGAGVKTTRKEARASASDPRHDQRSVVLAANPRTARWALYGGENIATISGATTAPRYVYNIVHTPPSEVYTAGFQPGNEFVDTNRFTGNAVRFFSIARFQTK